MKVINKFSWCYVLALLVAAGPAVARENIGMPKQKSTLRTTDAGCQPASSAIEMEINNVNARLMTGGDMWWNIGLGVAAYEIPKGSGKSSQFAASCWIGGFDKQGQLKMAGQTYRQTGNDYWPGALDLNAKITQSECNLWDCQWKVDASTINKFIAAYKSGGNYSQAAFPGIYSWPGAGSPTAANAYNGALLQLQNTPFLGRTYGTFKDLNNNGIYEPGNGEYPVLESNGVQSVPDELIWWVFNDAGNVKEMSLTAAIGVEIQTSAFAFATQDFLNNSTFCNYRVINRGALSIDSTYIAVWDDCDLGYAFDDFIGCDTVRGLGIQYNGTNCDGCAAGNPVNSYGENPPQVGLDFFQGPKKLVTLPNGKQVDSTLSMTNFTYYNNDNSIIGNPFNGVGMYFYMTGSILTGQRFSDDFQGLEIPSKGYGSGPTSNYVFFGNMDKTLTPGNASLWSECNCGNNPGDRRFIFSSGPFELIPGAINDITFGCVWAPQPVGGCGVGNFTTVKSIDDQAQLLFDSHFKTVEGPQAPRLQIRELDRKLLCYLVNDYGSNNYAESYGRTDGTYADSLQYHQLAIKALGSNNKSDSLYKFEGYRVFQLANNQVQPADIFDQTTGEVDNTKAVEVFQCDVKNGITQIVNYAQNLNVSDTTNVAQIKVNGKDSGIVHSFQLTIDQFAQTSDNQFINYHTYYFVAVAYAYNNFASFDPRNSGTTQDQPYLGSSHGAGFVPIPVVTALPNPTDGNLGTILNTSFGSGVAITRVEGQGNGGNVVELDPTAEHAAITDTFVKTALYQSGSGPIAVKVVDPVKVGAYKWALQITNNPLTGLLDSNAGWRLTAYNMDGSVHDTIYSETGLSTVNEQILENYGISVAVNQVSAAGTTVPLPQGGGFMTLPGNGYITSSITFADSTKAWLYGVADQSDSSFANWLRCGDASAYNSKQDSHTNPCNFNDNRSGGSSGAPYLDSTSAYQNMFANFSPVQSTWGPYVLAAYFFGGHATSTSTGGYEGYGSQCGFEVAVGNQTQTFAYFQQLPDVDLVFTDSVQYWTRCAVVEMQEDPNLAQGFSSFAQTYPNQSSKFYLRKHAGWHSPTDVASDNMTPIYSSNLADYGMSWFPGYAIDEGTGKRLNIVFGEDSYLEGDNGSDMIWNPTSRMFSVFNNSIIFGGKHIVYILGSEYDEDQAFVTSMQQANPNNSYMKLAYSTAQWVGIPLTNPDLGLTSLGDHLIPTTTRLKFRVNRPYAPMLAADTTTLVSPKPLAGNATNPYYTWTTSGMQPTPSSDNPQRGSLLSSIQAVPNPYYGYSGYETNRFDTRVRIVNLPAQASVSIYTLDGKLVRILSKNDPNTPYIDWDLNNTAGLPVSSGMYLMDVKANGIGETVIKWFGAMRPIDVTSY